MKSIMKKEVVSHKLFNLHTSWDSVNIVGKLDAFICSSLLVTKKTCHTMGSLFYLSLPFMFFQKAMLYVLITVRNSWIGTVSTLKLIFSLWIFRCRIICNFKRSHRLTAIGRHGNLRSGTIT